MKKVLFLCKKLRKKFCSSEKSSTFALAFGVERNASRSVSLVKHDDP